jgi:hypothetical protein
VEDHLSEENFYPLIAANERLWDSLGRRRAFQKLTNDEIIGSSFVKIFWRGE